MTVGLLMLIRKFLGDNLSSHPYVYDHKLNVYYELNEISVGDAG